MAPPIELGHSPERDLRSRGPRGELYSLRTTEFTKRLAMEQDLPKCIISMQLPEVYCKTHISNFSDTTSTLLLHHLTR